MLGQARKEREKEQVNAQGVPPELTQLMEDLKKRGLEFWWYPKESKLAIRIPLGKNVEVYAKDSFSVYDDADGVSIDYSPAMKYASILFKGDAFYGIDNVHDMYMFIDDGEASIYIVFGPKTEIIRQKSSR